MIGIYECFWLISKNYAQMFSWYNLHLDIFKLRTTKFIYTYEHVLIIRKPGVIVQIVGCSYLIGIQIDILGPMYTLYSLCSTASLIRLTALALTNNYYTVCIDQTKPTIADWGMSKLTYLSLPLYLLFNVCWILIIAVSLKYKKINIFL